MKRTWYIQIKIIIIKMLLYITYIYSRIGTLLKTDTYILNSVLIRIRIYKYNI